MNGTWRLYSAIMLMIVGVIGAVVWQLDGSQTVADAPIAVVAAVSPPVTVRSPSTDVAVAPPTGTVRSMPRPDSAVGRRDMTVVAALAPRGSADSKVMTTAMAAQPRNAAKLAPVEDSLRVAFGRLPAIAASGPVRITCVTTTCEVTGEATPGRSAAEIEAALRSRVLTDALFARGYSPGPVTVADAGNGRLSFVYYLNDEM